MIVVWGIFLNTDAEKPPTLATFSLGRRFVLVAGARFELTTFGL